VKIGDLVKHRFDGRYDDVGVIIEYHRNVTGVPGGMVGVMWAPNSDHRSDWLYRSRDLEVAT
jgi:hypothetical protein